MCLFRGIFILLYKIRDSIIVDMPLSLSLQNLMCSKTISQLSITIEKYLGK